jgi:hypothetical protein
LREQPVIADPSWTEKQWAGTEDLNNDFEIQAKSLTDTIANRKLNGKHGARSE